jgi:sulfur-oxidizing protein SoxX
VRLLAAAALGLAGVSGVAHAGDALAAADAVAVNGGALADYALAVSLTGAKGDAARGRAIVVNRRLGLCLLCHSGPFEEEQFQGNLAPDLRGTGRRWSEGQLRLRIVDSGRLNPGSIMPSYFRTEGLVRVAPAYRDQPVLSAQQIEDVVAFLLTLRDQGARTSER